MYKRKISRKVEKIVEGVEGRTPWRKGKALCRKSSASQHIEDNGSVVWDSGVSGQNSVCSRPWVA